MRQLAGCDDGRTCPRVFEVEDVIVVQGALMEDQEVTSVTLPGEGERVVTIPREIFMEAARRLVGR